MAVDRNGHTVAVDDVYLVAGKVRRIDGDTVLMTIGEDGCAKMRVDAADVVLVDDALAGDGLTEPEVQDLIDDAIAAHNAAGDPHPGYALENGGAFHTTAPTSSVTPSIGTNQLTRQVDLDNLTVNMFIALSGKQDLDATLTALAGLATGANKLAYSTGTDTFAQTDLTSHGRALIDDADAAASRATIGLDQIRWKLPVRVATTANGTLSTAFENGDTIDGVTLATGDRILLKDQSTAADRGIYTVNASGAPTRATDADAGSEINYATVVVLEGTVNKGRCYTQTTSPITIGSTSQTWALTLNWLGCTVGVNVQSWFQHLEDIGNLSFGGVSGVIVFDGSNMVRLLDPGAGTGNYRVVVNDGIFGFEEYTP